jgi:hypothetical protein
MNVQYWVQSWRSGVGSGAQPLTIETYCVQKSLRFGRVIWKEFSISEWIWDLEHGTYAGQGHGRHLEWVFVTQIVWEGIGSQDWNDVAHDRMFWTRGGTFGFQKMQAVSWAVELVASQERMLHGSGWLVTNEEINRNSIGNHSLRSTHRCSISVSRGDYFFLNEAST